MIAQLRVGDLLSASRRAPQGAGCAWSPFGLRERALSAKPQGLETTARSQGHVLSWHPALNWAGACGESLSYSVCIRVWGAWGGLMV